MKVIMTIKINLTDDVAVQEFLQATGAAGIDHLEEAIRKSFADDLEVAGGIAPELTSVEIEP